MPDSLPMLLRSLKTNYIAKTININKYYEINYHKIQRDKT